MPTRRWPKHSSRGASRYGLTPLTPLRLSGQRVVVSPDPTLYVCRVTAAQHASVIAGISKDDARARMEAFALQVFAAADNDDRSGTATQQTAHQFYAAYVFMDVCRQWGELASDLEQKIKYAMWKAADINKAIKEGRVPRPGGADEDDGFGVGRRGWGVGGGGGIDAGSVKLEAGGAGGGASIGGFVAGGGSGDSNSEDDGLSRAFQSFSIKQEPSVKPEPYEEEKALSDRADFPHAVPPRCPHRICRPIDLSLLTLTRRLLSHLNRLYLPTRPAHSASHRPTSRPTSPSLRPAWLPATHPVSLDRPRPLQASRPRHRRSHPRHHLLRPQLVPAFLHHPAGEQAVWGLSSGSEYTSSSRYSPALPSQITPSALPPVDGKSRSTAVKEAERLMKHAGSALSFDDVGHCHCEDAASRRSLVQPSHASVSECHKTVIHSSIARLTVVSAQKRARLNTAGGRACSAEPVVHGAMLQDVRVFVESLHSAKTPTETGNRVGIQVHFGCLYCSGCHRKRRDLIPHSQAAMTAILVLCCTVLYCTEVHPSSPPHNSLAAYIPPLLCCPSSITSLRN